MSVTVLKLSRLIVDEFIQPRVKTSDATIEQYAEDMQTQNFPPIVVFEIKSKGKTIFVIADGVHRFHATEKLGEDSIKCDVKQGTRVDAFLFAATANRKHGLQLTKADRRSVISKFFTDKELKDDKAWTDGKIAAHVRCSQQYVSRVHKQVSPETVGGKKVVERGGKKFEMDTTKVGKKKTPKKAAAKEKEPAQTAAKKPAKKVSKKDGSGLKIPDLLLPVFEQRHEFIAFQDNVTTLIDEANALFKLPHDAGKHCDIQRIVKLLNDARVTSRRGMPHATCHACIGKQCKHCKGKGWLTEQEAKS